MDTINRTSVNMDKVALITGGTRGIGLGIAKALASENYMLALNGLREKKLVDGVMQELSEEGIKVIYCQGNIALKTDRDKIINEVKKEFGHLNVLINNAGMAPRERKDILEATEESFEEIISTNLQGPYFLTQLAARWMIEEKKKYGDFFSSIINISSVSATFASVNRGDYCISKAGIGMMTKLYAVRLAEYNIPVFEIRPGVIATDMTAGVRDKYDKMISEGLTVQKRWGQPADVGKAVLMLLRGDISYGTGQVILVDGGMSIERL